ncbi:MAG: hypothetical protein OXE78_00975 [Gammaproteobacteria bacterium]|nr:hypothetical protein [Gammaproteobacteria bacterium]MCY4357614.1 hypothetical protein [Gammaproteobacteria bacterium]
MRTMMWRGPVWIYQYIQENRRAGDMLYQYLRRRGKKPNWQGGKQAGHGHNSGRVDIAERPRIVEEKAVWAAGNLIRSSAKVTRRHWFLL